MAEHPIYDVDIEKVRVNTGTKDKPFYATESETKRVRLFGILLKRQKDHGNFPEPVVK
jgi:hypothetical protein